VGERINNVRKKVVAGPDGLMKEHLMIPGMPAILAMIFNILSYSSYFPTVWEENRTTLIPKVNKPSSQVENWRPITIGPILGRIFSSSLDGRMRKGVMLNLRQKGFTFENGCKINIDLFNVVLSYSTRNNEETFAIVDISKAFDTIPHPASKPCLARKDVPTPIIELVKNMYNEDKITIKSKDDIGVKIKILGGVKQGDPLSPLLFNLCLEPLLEMIGEQTSGITVSQTRKVPVLAFADDIVLLVEDEKEAQR
jgi:hypothetical protein